VRASGPQQVTVEDSMSNVHTSRGRLRPASDRLLSEVAIVCRLARAVLGESPAMPWSAFEADCGLLRDRIAQVVAGFEDFNGRLAGGETGFTLPHPARDERRFPTATGRARLSVNPLEVLRRPARSPAAADDALPRPVQHDDLRPQRPLPRHQGPAVASCSCTPTTSPSRASRTATCSTSSASGTTASAAGALPRRRLPDRPRCAAAYYPETNPLVPLDHHAAGSRTPASRSIVVRLERTRKPADPESL
jgi:hypothetical protein